MKPISTHTNSFSRIKGLFCRKSFWLPVSMFTGLFVLGVFLRPAPQGSPAPQDSKSQARSSAPASLANTPSSSSSSTARGELKAAAALTNAPAAPKAAMKDPANDESPLRRWQLGTHWGKESRPEMKGFSTWTERYLAAAPTARGEMLAEGAELAQRRRAAYRELIVSEPREALASSVPFAVRQQLPASVTAQLEQRVSGKGDFLVLATVPHENMPAEQPSVLRQALIGQERFTAHVFGQRKDQRTTTGISLHGVALDGQLALSESPVRLLEAGEPMPSGMKLAEPVCSVSGLTAGAPETAGAVLAASGDQVHWLCRGGHLEALEHTVKQAEGGSAGSIEGVVAPSYESTGSRKILVMMVDFSDYPGGAVSLADAQAALNDVTTFIRANAFNQLSFTTKQVTPVLRMPRTASSYVSLDDPYSLLADARSAAAAAGFNPANYDFDVVAFTGIGFGWGGLGYVGWKGSWVQGGFSRAVLAHELGHNFGNWHANSWVSSTIVGSDGTHVEYGNPFDVLGNAYNFPVNHHSANFKFRNGWLLNANLHTVTASGTYRIYAQDFGGNLRPARKYGIRIPVSITAGGETMDYWLDFRPGYTLSGTTANGAVLQWANDSGTASANRLLDTHPETLGWMEDAPLQVGETFNDLDRSLSITTLSKGYSGSDPYLDIQINFSATPPVTLGEALDLPGAPWSTGGERPWLGQTLLTHDGTDAAMSGLVADSQESYAETTVSGPVTVRFYWKVSSELNYDFLSFQVDGLTLDSMSGEQNWQELTHVLPAGTHTLRWKYGKDGTVSFGADRGWVDQLTIFTTPSNDMFADSPLIPPAGNRLLVGSNEGATRESGEPDHARSGGHSVWWKWTAPANQAMHVSTLGSSFDTVMAVYTGTSVSALTPIGANDDNGNDLSSTVVFAATAGVTYYIAVDGYYGATGFIRLSVAPLAPLRLLELEPLGSGAVRIWLASSDGQLLEPVRAAQTEIHSSLGPTGYSWTRLNYPLAANGGLFYMDDPSGTASAKFYRAVENP